MTSLADEQLAIFMGAKAAQEDLIISFDILLATLEEITDKVKNINSIHQRMIDLSDNSKLYRTEFRYFFGPLLDPLVKEIMYFRNALNQNEGLVESRAQVSSLAHRLDQLEIISV
jgi:hypothetical protein